MPTAAGSAARLTGMLGRIPCRIISPIPDRRKGILFTKRQTDMPSDQKMLFFTPELYRRFNSRDQAEALAANAEWEQAIARYC